MANYAKLRPSLPHQRAQMGFRHPPALPQPAIQPNQLKVMKVTMDRNFWRNRTKDYWKNMGGL